MEPWNSLPDNIRHLDLSLGQFRWALKTHVLTESVAPSDPYFSALTKFTYLLTYLLILQKKQLKQYIISCKTVADALKITILNTKTSSAAGRFVPWPHTGDSASGPPLGAPPQTPIVGSRFRALHGCVFDPTFLYPPRPCMGPLPSSFVQSFPMPSSELRRITHENVEL